MDLEKITWNIFPHSHRDLVSFQGLPGVTGWCSWQVWHSLQSVSMSLFMLVQKTLSRASCWGFPIPWCPSWSWLRMSSWRLLGIISRWPIQMTPDAMAHSARTFGNSLIELDHPCLIIPISDCRTGSLVVSCFRVDCFSGGSLSGLRWWSCHPRRWLRAHALWPPLGLWVDSQGQGVDWVHLPEPSPFQCDIGCGIHSPGCIGASAASGEARHVGASWQWPLWSVKTVKSLPYR